MITVIKDSLPLPLMRKCLDESQKQFHGDKLRTNSGWGHELVQERDRKSTRLDSSHTDISRMPSSA